MAAAAPLPSDSAFPITDIAGRGAFERRDSMRLLEFAHGDDVLLAAVQRFGERQRYLRLAYTRCAAEHEHADGLVRVVELAREV